MDRTSVMWLRQLGKCNQATLQVIAQRTKNKIKMSSIKYVEIKYDKIEVC